MTSSVNRTLSQTPFSSLHRRIARPAQKVALTPRTPINPTEPYPGQPRPFTVRENRRAIESTIRARDSLVRAGQAYAVRSDVMVAVWFENQRRVTKDDATATQRLRTLMENDGDPTPLQLRYLSAHGPKFGASALTMERLDELLRAGTVVLPNDLDARIPVGRTGDLVRRSLADGNAYANLGSYDRFRVNAYLLSETSVAPTLIAANLNALGKQYVAKGGDPSALHPDSPTQYRIYAQLAARGPYVGSQRATSAVYDHGRTPINFAGYCADKNYPLFAQILRGEAPADFEGYFQRTLQ